MNSPVTREMIDRGARSLWMESVITAFDPAMRADLCRSLAESVLRAALENPVDVSDERAEGQAAA